MLTIKDPEDLRKGDYVALPTSPVLFVKITDIEYKHADMHEDQKWILTTDSINTDFTVLSIYAGELILAKSKEYPPLR